MTNIIAISAMTLYLIVGISTGFNVAYRIIKLKKQAKREFLLAIITLPISAVVWGLAMVSLIAFHMKRKYERVAK